MSKKRVKIRLNKIAKRKLKKENLKKKLKEKKLKLKEGRLRNKELRESLESTNLNVEKKNKTLKKRVARRLDKIAKRKLKKDKLKQQLKEKKLKLKEAKLRKKKFRDSLEKLASFSDKDNLNVEEVSKILDEAANSITDREIVKALGITNGERLDEKEYDEAKATFLEIFTEEELGERIQRYFASRGKKTRYKKRR